MLQKPRELRPGAQAAVTMIAANGPLDGPPVESDAEILELYGDSLSRRDRVQFGSTEDMTGFELADLTGVIGGGPSKPLPIRPDAIVSPNRPPLQKPPRADRFDCLAFGASCRHTLMVDGTAIATPLPCGECQPCREWRVFKIMVRYRHGRGDSQTVVSAPGFANVDQARKWSTAQGKRFGAARLGLLIRRANYLWESWIVYADRITEHQLNLTRHALKRKGINGSAEHRPISPEVFQAIVPRDACVEGLEGIKRRTCVFTGWPDYEEEPSDHLHDDGYTETGIMQTQREPTPLPGWAQMRASLPLEERAALNAEDWCAVETLNEYMGPSALRQDAHDWLMGKVGPWRECYRPMLRLLGHYDKAPPTVCQGCGNEAPLTPKGLCIRCALDTG